MQYVCVKVKKRGYTVDPPEIDNKVATGPRKLEVKQIVTF